MSVRSVVTNPQSPSRIHWKITLGVVVLLAVMGWLVAWPAYQRHRAIDEIERAGGRVFSFNEIPPITMTPGGGEPSWWTRRLGIQLPSKNVGVTFYPNGQSFDSSKLKFIPDIPTVEWVILNDVPTNGAGLDHLNHSDVTTLQLANSRIEDSGLQHVIGIKSLEELLLNGTDITDRGLEQLRDLPNLQILLLNGTKISDDGLEHLHHLMRLTHLHLDNTDISDSGLRHLTALPDLYVLSLAGTQVTRNGVNKFRQIRPDCTIYAFGEELPALQWDVKVDLR